MPSRSSRPPAWRPASSARRCPAPLLSLRGVAGLDGWQWLFLVEGLPAVVLGIVALMLSRRSARSARWLPDDEKAWLLDDAAARARRGRRHALGTSVRAGLLNPEVWRLALVLFLIVTSGYGFSFFLPQIVKAAVGRRRIWRSGL